MKSVIFSFFLIFQSYVYAGVPYCNIAETIEGVPYNSQVLEFKKDQKMEISTTDKAATLVAHWDEQFKFYQMHLSVGANEVNGIFEVPSKSGFLNYQDGKRNFSAQCRFELN